MGPVLLQDLGREEGARDDSWGRSLAPCSPASPKTLPRAGSAVSSVPSTSCLHAGHQFLTCSQIRQKSCASWSLDLSPRAGIHLPAAKLNAARHRGWGFLSPPWSQLQPQEHPGESTPGQGSSEVNCPRAGRRNSKTIQGLVKNQPFPTQASCGCDFLPGEPQVLLVPFPGAAQAGQCRFCNTERISTEASFP